MISNSLNGLQAYINSLIYVRAIIVSLHYQQILQRYFKSDQLPIDRYLQHACDVY